MPSGTPLGQMNPATRARDKYRESPVGYVRANTKAGTSGQNV